jgi:hypothetical protein
MQLKLNISMTRRATTTVFGTYSSVNPSRGVTDSCRRKTFAYWMDNRYSDWLADRQVKPMAAVADEPIKYRAGFHGVVAKWNHSPYHEFIDDLHELGTAAAIEADKKRRGRADYATRTPTAQPARISHRAPS